jgi:hypothetical protein
MSNITTPLIVTSGGGKDTIPVTVTVARQCLWDAQCARSEYSGYGSNDREHEVLLELAGVLAHAVGLERDYDTWRLVCEVDRDLVSADDAIRGRIPSELAARLTLTRTGDWECTLTTSVENEALGVALKAAGALAAAVAAFIGDAASVTVERAGATIAAEPWDIDRLAPDGIAAIVEGVAAQWQHLIRALCTAGASATLQHIGGMRMAIRWPLGLGGMYATLTELDGSLNHYRADALGGGYRVDVYDNHAAGAAVGAFTLPTVDATDPNDDARAARHAVAFSAEMYEIEGGQPR